MKISTKASELKNAWNLDWADDALSTMKSILTWNSFYQNDQFWNCQNASFNLKCQGFCQGLISQKSTLADTVLLRY